MADLVDDDGRIPDPPSDEPPGDDDR